MQHNENPEAPSKPESKLYRFFQNRRNVIVAVIFVLSLISISLVIILNQKGETTPVASEQQLIETTATISGKAEISDDGQEWEPSVNNKKIRAGSYIRTSENSRAIITFEDESVARLDYSTSLRIESLHKNNISITHQTGNLYNRAITGSGYSVMIDGATFSAKGTAFRTTNTPSNDTLEVFEGTVTALINEKNLDVASGNGLYATDSSISKDSASEKINLTQLQNDEFILWNLTRDSQNPNFKDNLGYLKDLSATAIGNVASPSKPTVVMNLAGQKTAENKFELSWSTSGLPEGTHTTLLFSRKTSNPNIYDFSNGENETSFVDIGGRQNFTWDYPDGQTVWFRLCAYNLDAFFGQEELLCNVGASNVISYQAPYVAEKIVQPGAINLTAEGTVLSWTYEGTAPFGFVVIGLSFVDFKASTTSTSLDIGNTLNSYDYYYVCKKGYHEQINCSEGISIDR
jgi:hypothetical protein